MASPPHPAAGVLLIQLLTLKKGEARTSSMLLEPDVIWVLSKSKNSILPKTPL